jgi:cyclophilin family peptidyl-prolyl cis-trans isomerase
MNTKALSILAILIVLGVGGYFGFKSMNKDTQEPAQTNDQTNVNTNEENKVTEETPKTDETPVPDTAVVKFETNFGNFEVTLDGKTAPLTVKNFLAHVNAGFYNGKKFYRVENQDPQFLLIQGGDPEQNSGVMIPAEIKLKHTKGAIAMARNNNPQKASSDTEFYITFGDVPQLDGNYTVFGYTSSGMNVLEKIGATPTEPDPGSGLNLPLKDIIMTKVTVVK